MVKRRLNSTPEKPDNSPIWYRLNSRPIKMSTPTNQQRLDACQPPHDQSHVMYQSWKELLFLHWQIDPAVIQATLPPGLTVDTFGGNAYLGIVPFYMCNIRPRFLPAVPGISDFLEMNVRTYVHDAQGRPGVWFYSLDANQKLAVRVARKFFNLPYFDAKMTASMNGLTVNYHSQQKDSHETASYQYTPTEPAASTSAPEYSGSLEFFLTERYYLFAYNQKKQQLYSGRVHHNAYPLHQVEVNQYSDYPIKLAGFDQPCRAPDHALMSRGVDVKIYPLQEVL